MSVIVIDTNAATGAVPAIWSREFTTVSLLYGRLITIPAIDRGAGTVVATAPAGDTRPTRTKRVLREQQWRNGAGARGAS